MYSFYSPPDAINGILIESKGVGRYNSCTHIENVKVVPSIYYQKLGKSVSKTEDGYIARCQLKDAGYIVGMTYYFRNSQCHVYASATVFGPYWASHTKGYLSPMCISIHGWNRGGPDLALNQVMQYLDEVLKIDPTSDIHKELAAIQAPPFEMNGWRFGWMNGSMTCESIQPWNGKIDMSQLANIIEHSLRVAIASYDDAPLLNQALESYRLDLGVTKELVDTASGLAAVKTVADLAKSLLPELPKRVKTLKDFAKYLASTKLWYEYGYKLPLKTLSQWSTALKPQQIAKYCLTPGELRSGTNRVLYKGHPLFEPEDTVEIEMDTRLGLGLKPQSETVEFINSLYRYGVLMSLADGWDLIPLSFAVNWVTTLPAQFAQKLSNYADYWRFSYSYARRTYKGHVCYAGAYTVDFDFYIRNYSCDIPKMSMNKQLRLIGDEGITGSLSLSSLDEAVSLITVLT
jgi:hypothetical protein